MGCLIAEGPHTGWSHFPATSVGGNLETGHLLLLWSRSLKEIYFTDLFIDLFLEKTQPPSQPHRGAQTHTFLSWHLGHGSFWRARVPRGLGQVGVGPSLAVATSHVSVSLTTEKQQCLPSLVGTASKLTQAQGGVSSRSPGQVARGRCWEEPRRREGVWAGAMAARKAPRRGTRSPHSGPQGSGPGGPWGLVRTGAERRRRAWPWVWGRSRPRFC